MTEKIIVGIINTSVTGGISIGIFWFLSWMFRKKYRAVVRKNAWILIAVYLLIPLNLDIFPHTYTIQLPNFTSREQEKVSQAADDVAEHKRNDAIGDSMIQSPNKASFLTGFSMERLLFAVWSAGILFLIFYYLMIYHKTCTRVRRWSHECQDEWIMGKVTDVAAEVGLSKIPRIRILESSTDGPFTMGILKNFVFLPESDYAEKDLYYILKHELIHCREKDILWKLLFLIANIVHWFNPFVWFMCKIAENDIEQVCDDEVLKGVLPEEYREYSDIIMRWVKSGRRNVLSTGYVAGAAFLKARFTNIFESSHKRNSILPIVISILILFFVNSGISVRMGEKIYLAGSVPIVSGLEVRTDIDGDGETERVYISDNRSGDYAFTQVSAQFRNGNTVFTDYEGYWSSYIVTGDLSGNGRADVVVMRVSTGSTYGGGEATILHMENGKWEEYPCRFIHNSSIELEQPDNFHADNFDFSAMGVTIITRDNRTMLRIIANHDMGNDMVKCIDCSYRNEGWYIEDIQIVYDYYSKNKDIELLGDFF